MIHFRPCACPPGKMARVHRSGWMRSLFPSRVLYHCDSCGCQFLASVRHQTELGLRAQAERLRTAHAPIRQESAAPSPTPTPAG